MSSINIATGVDAAFFVAEMAFGKKYLITYKWDSYRGEHGA